MTPDSLDLQLATWFEERTASAPPDDLLGRSLRRVERTWQRPAMFARGAAPAPVFGARGPLGAAAVLLLVALLAAAVAVIGAQTWWPQRSVVLPPAVTPTQQATVVRPPSDPPGPVGPLGGGPIVAHTFSGTGDKGPFDVVAIDAGTEVTILLGTLPGASQTLSSQPYRFLRNRDLSRVIPVSQIAPPPSVRLEHPTDAAVPFGFTPAPELAQETDWMALSPEGDRFAAVRRDKFDTPLEIVIVDLDDTVVARLPIPPAMTWIGMPVWAPDGSAILLPGCRPCNKAQTPQETQTAEHSHLYLAPIDGSPWQELLDIDNGAISAQWSPDGTRLAIERYRCARGSFMPRCDPMEATSSLSVLTLSTGAETSLGETPGITGVDWSPDGRRIAYGSLDGAFAVDAATGVTVKLADRQSAGADWAPDGQWLLVDRQFLGGGPFAIWIVRSDGQALHRVLDGYAAPIW